VAEPALDALVDALRRLPGVGEKSARRMALHLLQHDRSGAQRLALSLQAAVANVRHCARCHTFTESDICSICANGQRDARLLCVVETPADQSAMERTGSYAGYYFVLMGRLSPLDGIGVHDIGLQALLNRAAEDGVEEVCVIGGAALFAAALPRAKRLYLTEVDAEVDGDTYFPAFDEADWIEVQREDHPADEKNQYAFTTRVLEKR